MLCNVHPDFEIVSVFKILINLYVISHLFIIITSAVRIKRNCNNIFETSYEYIKPHNHQNNKTLYNIQRYKLYVYI